MIMEYALYLIHPENERDADHRELVAKVNRPLDARVMAQGMADYFRKSVEVEFSSNGSITHIKPLARSLTTD